MRKVYYDVIWPVLVLTFKQMSATWKYKACKYNRFYSLLAARDTASMAVRNGDRRLYSGNSEQSLFVLASPQTSFGARLSRIHFSPTDKRTPKDVCGEAMFVPTWSFCTTWLTSCKSKGLLRSKSKHDPPPSRKDLSSVFFKRHVVLCPWGVTRYTWIVTKMSAGIN